MGGGLLAFVAGAVVGVRPATWVGQLAGPVGAGLFGATAEREYAILDAGLVVPSPATFGVIQWDRFEGYAVTGEAVSIRRTAAWRARRQLRPRGHRRRPGPQGRALAVPVRGYLIVT